MRLLHTWIPIRLTSLSAVATAMLTTISIGLHLFHLVLLPSGSLLHLLHLHLHGLVSLRVLRACLLECPFWNAFLSWIEDSLFNSLYHLFQYLCNLCGVEFLEDFGCTSQ